MGPFDGPWAVLVGSVFVRLPRWNPEQGAGRGFVTLAAEACPAAASGAENHERGGRAFWAAGLGDRRRGKDAGVGHEQAAEKRVFFQFPTDR